MMFTSKDAVLGFVPSVVELQTTLACVLARQQSNTRVLRVTKMKLNLCNCLFVAKP